MAAAVSHACAINAIAKYPEIPSRPAETAEPEHRLLQALRIGRLQLTAVDEMADSGRDRRSPARQRLGCARPGSGFAHEQHGYLPGGTSLELKKGSHNEAPNGLSNTRP